MTNEKDNAIQQAVTSLVKDGGGLAPERLVKRVCKDGFIDCGAHPKSEAREVEYIRADLATPASAAPVVDEDQQLVQRIRSLVESAFITGHMHGPSADYQVQLKFRTLKESQHCQTLIEALVHPEYRASFIKQGVLEPFTAAATAAPERTSSDTWGRWFERLGDKATAEIVNATADLVTDERLAALVDAKVLPAAAPVEQSERQQVADSKRFTKPC